MISCADAIREQIHGSACKLDVLESDPQTKGYRFRSHTNRIWWNEKLMTVLELHGVELDILVRRFGAETE